MRLVTDRPTALKGKFILMGVVEDGMRRFAGLFDTSNGNIYVEEMYWEASGVRGNEMTARLRYLDSDVEWQAILNFIQKKTTIFSPTKLRRILRTTASRGVLQLDRALKSDRFPYAPREVTDKKIRIPLPQSPDQRK